MLVMPTPAEAVAEYFAAIRAMNPDRWVAAFAPDAVSHDPVGAPPHIGRAALHAFISGIGSMAESINLTEEGVFINGNSAAVKWRGAGVGKNGKHFAFEGIDVIDCNDAGQIVLVKAYWDANPVMAALQS